MRKQVLDVLNFVSVDTLYIQQKLKELEEKEKHSKKLAAFWTRMTLESTEVVAEMVHFLRH